MLTLSKDAAFEQLWIFAGSRNKYLEMVAFAERYLNITDVENKEWSKHFRLYLSVKLADGKIPIKKGKNSNFLCCICVSLNNNRQMEVKSSKKQLRCSGP